MKKAVIAAGARQYIVSEGETIEVDRVKSTDKTITFEPLLVISDDKIIIGQPIISESKITAEVIEPDFKGEKVQAIRYKAKKRVHKIHGHRQHYTKIKVNSIK